MLRVRQVAIFIFCFTVACFFSVAAYATTVDPLPSWQEGPAKKSILNFIKATTAQDSPHFVPVNERVAVFDQDGTLWVEQPLYTQVIFALDRVRTLAKNHPDWKNKSPMKELLARDKATMAKWTLKDFITILMLAESGMSVEDFKNIAANWLQKTNNPRWQRPYTALVYQPMLEVLALFRAHDYQTYIVTGGGQDFVRVYAGKVYGIPPEKVIGSATATQYGYDKQGRSTLTRLPKMLLNDDYAGKAEDISLFIGRRPQAAFGNSTGDQQMLEYTEASKGMSLMMLVHHDDAKREFAYGADSKVGTFSTALMAEAKKRGWVVISMKNDWKRIFPFDK